MAWNLNPYRRSVASNAYMGVLWLYPWHWNFLKIGYDLIKQRTVCGRPLRHKPDGTYTAAPSTSPEHARWTRESLAHAVVREYYWTPSRRKVLWNGRQRNAKQWKTYWPKLVPYIGRYGQLLEWSTDIDDPERWTPPRQPPVGLHPGHTISRVTTPELAQAARGKLNIAERRYRLEHGLEAQPMGTPARRKPCVL